MKKFSKNIFRSIVVVVFIAIIAIPIIGWVKNLIKFTQLDFEAPYKAEIIRGIGLTPLGVIIGWINIYDN